MKTVPLILFGFGNVGQSVARLLADNDGYSREGVRLTLHSVFDRGGGVLAEGHGLDSMLEAKRGNGSVCALPGGTHLDLGEAIEAAPGGVLVDCSITVAETGEPGLTAAMSALESGLSAVFASKGPLVASYRELSELSRRKGVQLGASAAVGIPLPSLEIGMLGLRGAGLSCFRGVLNTTSQQILADMESGSSQDEAVEKARLAGTLEQDPRLDLGGWDAAYKLLILARAFWDSGLKLDAVTTTGVDAVNTKELDTARGRGHRIRLVATGERGEQGKVRLRVRPEHLTPDDPLYSLSPGEKGLVFETKSMGHITVTASKSGPHATAACVIKDILNVTSPRRP